MDSEMEQAVAAVAGNPRREAVIETLQQDGSLTATEVAARQGVHRTTVIQALRPLEEVGVVASVAQKRLERPYWVTDLGECVAEVVDSANE